MTDQRIRKIVIVGGGTAGWMAGTAFAKLLDNGYTKITVIESDKIGTIGVGEATIPPITSFNAILGIQEADFMRATQGTFKLGIEFRDWGSLGKTYYHPFGDCGRDIRGVSFHQLYMRERLKRSMPDIGEYSLNAVMAKNGRFGRPDRMATFPGDLVYAYHFDAGLYANFLRAYAEARGVERIEGEIVDSTLRGADGFVESVTLDGGKVVEGDLFIDCSGFRGLLIEEKLKTGYESWTQWLPCDRAIAVPTANVSPALNPATRSTARSAGWQWHIPLQHRTGNGMVYSSSHMADDEAERLLLDNLEGPPLAPPRRLSFTTGRRRLTWNRNVVALGLSSGFIEPLESTSIHLVQSGIAKLLTLFPDKNFNPIERNEFNRITQLQIEDIRDFVVLHYKATHRTDSEFWKMCQAMSLPDSLNNKIEMFRSKGRSFRDGFELFALPSWVAVMFGQDIWPQGYDPMADTLDEAQVNTAMEELRSSYDRAARALPSHAQFIAQHCAAAQGPGGSI
jgi:tryptophan halogenase